MGGPPASLWSHSDFVRLWAGRTVSLLGSQITLLALPLVAIITLDVSPIEVGMLAAIGNVPTLLFGLIAGVWVDRLRRRPVMIVADLGQAVVLLCIPLVVLLDVLRIEYLYVVAFLMGSLALVFEIASGAFVPMLVGRERLIEAGGKLSLSTSAAEIAGPGLAGVLVQLLTAPFAIVVDAVTFLASALLVSTIRTPERAPGPDVERQRFWSELVDGLRFVIVDRVLLHLGGVSGWVTFWSYALEAVALLYLSREVGLSPIVLGSIFAISNVGLLIGALGAARITARLGVGPTLVAALVLTGLADLATPIVGGLELTQEAPLTVAMMLIGAQLVFGLAVVTYTVTSGALRQARTPDALRGRMTASMRVLSLGLAPLGSLVGGVLGQWIGLQPTLYLAAVGELLAAAWLLGSPVRQIREMPAPVAEG